MTMICACRMESCVVTELEDNIIYLSAMHITQRAIIWHDVSDTRPMLVNLDPIQRMKVRVRMRGEIMWRKGQYILKAMKIIEEHGCILAAHQFG